MAPVQPDDYKDSPLYKPCPDGVRRAMRHLIPDEDQRKTARVAGLGNTLEAVSVESGAAIPAELNVAPVEPNAADQTEPASSLSVLIKSWRAQSEEYDRALQGF